MSLTYLLNFISLADLEGSERETKERNHWKEEEEGGRKKGMKERMKKGRREGVKEVKSCNC